MVASDKNFCPADDTASFIAEIVVMDYPREVGTCSLLKREIKVGYEATIDCHTSHVVCKLTEIRSRLDRKTGVELEMDPESIKPGDSAIVKLVPIKPMVIETFRFFHQLGRFAMRDRKAIIAVGIVRSTLFVRKNKMICATCGRDIDINNVRSNKCKNYCSNLQPKSVNK